jgi:hypothetical protein
MGPGRLSHDKKIRKLYYPKPLIPVRKPAPKIAFSRKAEMRRQAS